MDLLAGPLPPTLHGNFRHWPAPVHSPVLVPAFLSADGWLLQSKTHVVVATLRRSQTELSSSLRKVFKVDDHMGIAISGIVSDGRSLCRYLRNECLNHKYG